MGHREADERVLPRLELVIDRLIQEDRVRHFYVGGYGGFDRIAAAATKRENRSIRTLPRCLCYRIIPLSAPQRLLMALMVHIIRKGWKTHQGGTQSCVPIKSW